MEGLDVVFNVALALLSLHKENLIKCTNFEEIMDYLKVTLTQVDKPTLEKIMKMVSVSAYIPIPCNKKKTIPGYFSYCSRIIIY